MEAYQHEARSHSPSQRPQRDLARGAPSGPGLLDSSSTGTTPGKDAGTHKDTGTTTKADTGKPKTDTGTTTKTDTGTTTKADTGVDSSQPVAQGSPPPSTGPATTSTTEHNFAIHHLYLGDTDPTPAFTTDANAWKNLGYNIDGLTSTMSSTGLCSPYNKS